MTTEIFSSADAYKFLKVEQYFNRYKEWERLGKVKAHSFDSKLNTLILDFDSPNCSLLIQIPRKDTFRLRFNPAKQASDYTTYNTRAVIQDTFADLLGVQMNREPFVTTPNTMVNGIELITSIESRQSYMKLCVTFDPFTVKVYNVISPEQFLVWETAAIPIYFTPNGSDDFAIIQAVRKPATAKYIGFGEQGGQSLCKNTAQVNYFNFDNMRYRQVYNCGPLDSREPLYHSDPVLFEFNGTPDKDSVNAIFIDNMGQSLVDIGYLNSSRYMFGTRHGDLDFYFFMGKNAEDIVRSFTSIVGRSRLKPRYALGFHQGCYGYDRREAAEWVVQKYRDYQIPLDGLHVDVDIQHNYQTFTVDGGKFPDVSSFFAGLKQRGVKCSTNITPIISNRDPNYSTYAEGIQNGHFITDHRYDAGDPAGSRYHCYGGGVDCNSYCASQCKIDGYNSGQPYIGEVYYGNDATGNELGTTGHYSDFGKSEVRKWWGNQYKYLFDVGLEMVWQDMTTPAIRQCRGDMKGFPFRLLITDDSLSGSDARPVTPAIKIWNLYSYNLHKATYHGLNNLPGREKRNFIIGRGSFTGSHRFAGCWTGDNASDWDFLKMNVSQVLSLGMCGVVINGQDIGGFETSMDGGRWASPELMIRWTAVGAFLPWFRNHYVRKGRKEFQEPFMYEEWFNQYCGGNLPEPRDLYRMVLPVCRHYIQLRYRLLQLFYDGVFGNTLTGLPICRPLFLGAPDDKALYNDKRSFLDNEFFVGNDLLVAPVLEPQYEAGINREGKRDVYLPTGSDWYCFMNNTMPLTAAVEGGTTVRDFDANLNLNGNHINFIVPAYVRAGAIIPTIELEQYVGQLNAQQKPNPITLNIYPGQSGKYDMYLDDGVSRSSAALEAHPKENGGDPLAAGEYRQTQIKHNYISAKIREISVQRVHEHPNFNPIENYFYIAVLHDPTETRGALGYLKSVKVDDQNVQIVTSGTPEERSSAITVSSCNAWYFNENINISFIKVLDSGPLIRIRVEYI